jgi:hypothetical protein
MCSPPAHPPLLYGEPKGLKIVLEERGLWQPGLRFECKDKKTVAIPLWAKCEGEAHTPENGKLESSGTPENSELDCRGQISSHLSDLGVIGKVLKCRCSKWPRMSHLDIRSPSYGRKKGRESNCQFDSRPLKSQESTCSRRALQECNISLESSFQGL